MECTYLYNAFGHFRPKNMLEPNNTSLAVLFFTTEVNNYIDPWVDFLKNPDEEIVHGNLTGLHKRENEHVLITARFSDRIDKENYNIYPVKISVMTDLIKSWKSIISQQPKGILMIFGEEYEDVEFVPDWKGCRYEIMQQELAKREPENADSEYTND